MGAMTPERLAEVEQLVAGGIVYLKPATAKDLIAHIRDLEAQLEQAREAIHEAKTKLEAIPSIDWNGMTPFNGVWNILHKADYATPPSPEVGE